MPYLSKKELSKKVKDDLEKQIVSLIADTGTKHRLKIFSELFTPTEKLVFAKRLAIILLLNKEIPFYKICDYLNVSPSTVARFENKFENKKYLATSQWLKRNDLETKLVDLLGILTASAFGKRGQSFGKMLDDL